MFSWPRRLSDAKSFALLTPAPGNTGLFAGQPGDDRSLGVTVRLAVSRP